MDHNGLLHYQGRKDHQIKLHGQRIELGEIERCLLNTSISACVVMKWGDDHLVAYVQTSDMNEEQLREHCQSHLPPHMIPSIFMILEKLPLNANGKIDRKRLPSPNFSSSDFAIYQMNSNISKQSNGRTCASIFGVKCFVVMDNKFQLIQNLQYWWSFTTYSSTLSSISSHISFRNTYSFYC